MALSLWWLRSPHEKFDPDEEYRGHPKVFTVKFNYDGRFTKPPGRTYVNGKVGFFDMVDSFEFGFHELESMTDCLDLHVGDEILYYYFKVPNSDLDNGLRALTNDTDLENLFKYVEEFKVIEIYTELGCQAIGTTEAINESQVSQVDNEVRTKDHIDEDDNGDGESGDEDNNGDDESSDEDDSEDSDFFVDSDDSCDDLEVDMNEFRSVVDIPVTEEHQHFASEDDNSDSEVDLDDFDSMNEDETPLSKAMKRARKKNRKGKDPVVAPFYVGQQFSNRDEVRDLVKKFCIESRRQLYFKKNDKERVRVLCAGVTYAAGGSKEVVVKSKVGGSQKVDESKKAMKAPMEENLIPTCPFVLHISNHNKLSSWVVKTFTNEHTCLNTRNVKLCTVGWIAKEAEQIVASNYNIPVKALQDQFQRKYQIQLSETKVFRARAMARQKIDGNFTTQYALLRDYCKELVRANPGTSVEIEVEKEFNPSSLTRQFKRVYICLAPLREGFKACGRDLLGLDDCFMKGPFPGQILTAVGVDSNNCYNA